MSGEELMMVLSGGKLTSEIVSRVLTFFFFALTLIIVPPLAAQNAPVEFIGSTPGGWLGSSIDCDGSEVIAGAPFANSGAGAVEIVDLVNRTSVPLPIPYSVPIGDEEFGHALAVIRNGSSSRLVVGAPGEVGGYGNVHIYTNKSSGPAFSFFGSGAGEPYFGYTINSIPDRNSDGWEDIVVSSPGASLESRANVGLIEIYSGLDGELLSAYDVAQPGERIGEAVALMHDVDGKGARDIAASAPEAQGGNGKIYIISTEDGKVLNVVSGVDNSRVFGISLARVPDVNGDGTPELLVGSIGVESGVSGAAQLLSGASLASGTEVLCEISGAGFGARFGEAVASLGDADLDGLVDFAVGAPSADRPGGTTSVSNQGAFIVYKYVGGQCRKVVEIGGFGFLGKEMGVAFARSGCDFDQDGSTDVIVGTRSDVSGIDTGSIVGYRGREGLFGREWFDAPLSIDLTYRLTQAGNLRVVTSVPQALPEYLSCDLELFARVPEGEGEVGDAESLGSFNLSESDFVLSALQLPKVLKRQGQVPVGHLLSVVTCGDRSVSSNVFSRNINCGRGTGVTGASWLGVVRERLTVDPLGLDRLKKKKKRKKIKRRKRHTSN